MSDADQSAFIQSGMAVMQSCMPKALGK